MDSPYIIPKMGSIRERDGSNFYNLYEADNLYNDFLRKYGKTYSEEDKLKHYYRFVKTLVELNRHNVNLMPFKSINADADKILIGT